MVPAVQSAGILPAYDYLGLTLFLPGTLFGSYLLVKHRRLPKVLPLLFFICFAAVSILWTPAAYRGRATLILAGLAACLPIASLFVSSRSMNSVRNTFAWTTAGTIVLSLVLSRGDSRALVQLGTTFVSESQVTNRNAIAAQAAIACLFAIFAYMSERRTRYLFLATSLGSFVLLSQSRAQFLALAVGLLLLASGKRAHNVRVRLMTASVVGLCCVSLLTLALPSIEPFAVIGRFWNEEDWTNGRSEVWQATREAVAADPWRPVIGTGLGAVDPAIGEFARYADPKRSDSEPRRSSHNTLSEWFVATGVLGMLALVVAGLALVKFARSQGRHQLALLGCSVVSAMALVYYRTPFWPVVGAIIWSPALLPLHGRQKLGPSLQSTRNAVPAGPGMALPAEGN